MEEREAVGAGPDGDLAANCVGADHTLVSVGLEAFDDARGQSGVSFGRGCFGGFEWFGFGFDEFWNFAGFGFLILD
jgi:hypothetical protein